MTLQTYPGGLWLPKPLQLPQTYYFAKYGPTAVIDAASEKVAFIMKAPKTGNVAKLCWATQTVTTGATLDIRLETVDLATGLPSGTLFGTNSNGSQVVADANDDVWFETSLTTNAAVTKGDLLALVISNPAASFGNMQISSNYTNGYSVGPLFPYGALYVSSWVANANINPICCLKYDDDSYSPCDGVYPITAAGGTSYNSGTNPNERGNRLQVPFKQRASGFWVRGDIDGDCTVKLYDSDASTVLLSKAIDKDVGINSVGIILDTFGGTAELLANTNYIISVLADTATSLFLEQFTVNAAAVMDAIDGGQNIHLATRNGGAWTYTTTQRALCGLIVDQFDDGAGAGGGLKLVGRGGLAG